MYSPLKNLALSLLKAPREAPEPPRGSHASVQVFRASPRFLTYRLLWLLVIGLFLLVGVGVLFVVGVVEQEFELVGVALGLLTLLLFVLFLIYFAIRVDYELRYYVVTDRSLRVREGAWIVREMTLTYANVQNLKMVQGPLQRAFGIRDLEVETAGGGASQSGTEGKLTGGGHNVKIAGVENAREIRDLILSFVKLRARDSGLGDLDEAPRTAAAGLAPGPELVAALRQVHAAASALRGAAGRVARSVDQGMDRGAGDEVVPGSGEAPSIG